MYQEYTGVGNELILNNIRELAKVDTKMIIRVPIIPGFNDDHKNIEMTAQFVKSLQNTNRIDILPYNRGGLEKSVRLSADFDFMKTDTPGDEDMEDIADVFRKQHRHILSYAATTWKTCTYSKHAKRLLLTSART